MGRRHISILAMTRFGFIVFTVLVSLSLSVLFSDTAGSSFSKHSVNRLYATNPKGRWTHRITEAMRLCPSTLQEDLLAAMLWFIGRCVSGWRTCCCML